MTPSDLKDQIQRANEARLLLENPLLIQALDAIETETVVAWVECRALDKEGKEAVWQLMKTAKKFRAILIGHVETGKLAKEQLRRFEEEGLLKRAGRRLKVM